MDEVFLLYKTGATNRALNVIDVIFYSHVYF